MAKKKKEKEINMRVHRLGDDYNGYTSFLWNTGHSMLRIRWFYVHVPAACSDVENCPRYIFYMVFLVKIKSALVILRNFLGIIVLCVCF